MADDDPSPSPPQSVAQGDPQHSHPARTGDDRRLRDNLAVDQRRQIGRKGGAAVSRDRTHMAEIGRRGGQAVARNPQHMAEIGRRGGAAVSRDRAHMAAIGRRGGAARGAHRDAMASPEPMAAGTPEASRPAEPETGVAVAQADEEAEE